MKTMLVWYLVTFSYGTQWSPPMATLEECQRVKEVISYTGKCIQIHEVIK